ncbi:MAG: hypothetical protein GX620_01395 [Chloroflexi bacterium]|nr:hypothetical protein [Chloroflexota bacterium]
MSEPLRCANHPNVTTYLRCNRCGKPICTKCVVRTPVGYRCNECVRNQQMAFYADFQPVYYVIAAAVALPLGLVAGWLIPRLGWFYALILGPIAGAAIAEIVRWAIRRRRGQYTWLVVCGAILLGWLPTFLLSVFGYGAAALMTGRGAYLASGAIGLLQDILYLVLAVGAAYARLRPARRI